MLPKRQLSTKKACQNHFKNIIPIPATEAQARIIPIPSINHATSFSNNYKNDSNMMVERDGSIVCEQNSKEHETNKQNHNHQANNLLGSEETDRNNRKQYPENKTLI